MAASTAQKPPAIYGAIASVIADVGAVGKDKVNKAQGFKYRSVDDVFNALHPALAKNKVFILPKVLHRDQQEFPTKSGGKMIFVVCKMSFTFFAEDGSSVEAIIVGEALDTGDKATNKAMAIAYKYACFQVFCIPTEEMRDPDAERPELEQGAAQAPKAPATSAKKTESTSAKAPAGEERSEDPGQVRVTQPMINDIRKEQERTGVPDSIMLRRKSIKAKSVEELTVTEYKILKEIFKITPDLKREETKNE